MERLVEHWRGWWRDGEADGAMARLVELAIPVSGGAMMKLASGTRIV